MKKKILKTTTAIMIAVMMLSSYAIGQQWSTNGVNIYNFNLGKVGFSTTGNFTTPSFLIDAKGDINLNLAASNSSAFRIAGNSTQAVQNLLSCTY